MPIEQNGALINADALARALRTAGTTTVATINGAMSADDTITRAIVSLGGKVGIEHQGAALNADAVQRILANGFGSQVVVPGFPLITSPQVFAVGDSITQYGNYGVGLTTSGTFTRASTIITGTTGVANQFYGTQKLALVNMTDTSFECIARNNYNATSTLGTTAAASPGIAVYSGSGADGTTTPIGSLGAAVYQSRFSARGIFKNLREMLGGGFEFIGNFGHNTALAPITSQITYALTQSPTLLQYMCGTNNINHSQNAATTWAAVKTDLDQIIASGVPAYVCAITPYGTAVAQYATYNPIVQSVNASIQAYCAANPTKLLFIDTFTPVYDSTNGCMYTTMSVDGLHPYPNGAYAMAQACYSTLSPYLTCPNILPRSAADQGTTVNGHTRLVARGPWVTTTGGTNALGSGTLPPGWNLYRSAGSATATSSLFDPGDGKGIKVQIVVRAGAANDIANLSPWGITTTLATLGISASDNAEYAFAAEIDWSNATAAGVGRLALSMGTNGSIYGLVNSSELTEVAGKLPDSGTAVVMLTGWIQMSDTNITSLTPQILVGFTSITGVDVTINVRDVVLLKK